MLEDYRKHAAERAEQGLVPKPLSAEWTAGLVELIKNPPPGEESSIRISNVWLTARGYRTLPDGCWPMYVIRATHRSKLYP